MSEMYVLIHLAVGYFWEIKFSRKS